MADILYNETKDDEPLPEAGTNLINDPYLLDPYMVQGSLNNPATIGETDASEIELRANAPHELCYFRGSNTDGLSTYTTFTGVVTRYVDITKLSTPTNGDNANLYSTNPNLYTFNTNMEFSVEANLSPATGTIRGFIGIGNQGIATPILTYIGNNNARIGFFFYDQNLYISTADGVGNTGTQIFGIDETKWNRYKIIFIAGNRAEFYINEVLVGTHETRLPTAGIAPIVFGLSSGDVTARILSIFNNYIYIFTKP